MSEEAKSFYDFTVTTWNGMDVPLDWAKGKVVLVVNTATGCGFTPQYEALERMYRDFNPKGFEILDMPCNQFLGQAPGTDDEIHQFCTLRYNTSFNQMKKCEVNGPNEHPLYTFLKSKQGFSGFTGEKAAFMDEFIAKQHPDYKATPDIKWNFTKFLVDRSGNVIARFEPTEDMKIVRAAVEKAL